MGLDAYVRCNCFEEGRTTPPPHAEHVKTSEWGPNLELPYTERDAHAEFDRWRETACPHPRFKLADERISNWAGVRAFQEALARAGVEHFPVLANAIPDGNYGGIEAEQAGAALEELEFFENEADLGANAFLVDSDTKEQIYDHVGAYRGVFTWAGTSHGFEAGFDAKGFFLKAPDEKGGAELFRAMRVEETRGEGDRAKLRDRDSERSIELSTTVLAREKSVRRYHVEVRPVGAEEFKYVLEPLRVCLEAAIASGNAVVWC